MDGTRYVDGVLVDTTQLSRTENSKAYHVLRNRFVNWEPGIHSGLQLTVNPVNTSRVDMAAGTGYAPNGEYVEVLAEQLNIQLADTALGAVNWVIAFYTETKTSPNPHETNGTLQPTENQRGVRVRVLTPSQFALLPLTDPTYTSDAQDRAMLVGIVTATGGALTTSNIEQPAEWRSLKYAVMATPGMSGVTIYNVGDTTPEGTDGIIKLDVGPNRLSWKAPTEGGFGASVNITADGFYTLTALGGSTISVWVIVAGLLLTGTQVTVAIHGLYSQDVPRMSNTDRHHRSMQGTGVPSATNPHGLSIDDISPGFATDITIHQQLMHANGIWRGSSASCLHVSIDEATNPDRLLITAPIGDDCYWVHGRRLTAISNTVLLFNDPALTDRHSVFEIVVDSVGDVEAVLRVEHIGTNLTLDMNNGIVFVNDHVTPGMHTLTWTSMGPGNGFYVSWDNSRTPVFIPNTAAHGLYLLRNGLQEVWYYIGNLASLPSLMGTYVDGISVLDPADRAEHLVLGQVYWTGISTGMLGYTYARGGVASLMTDLRLFGTLTGDHIRDDAHRELIEYPIDEHHANGIAIGRYDAQGVAIGVYGSLWAEQPLAGLTVTIWGQAPVYVHGKRFVIGSYVAPLTTLVGDNDATVIYVDSNGDIATVTLTLATFLLINSPGAFDSTEYYKTIGATYSTYAWVFTGTPIAVAIASGGNVVSLIDLRRNLSGGNVHVQPWSVGRISSTSPAHQAVEFYSLDAALTYAIAQGHENIYCSDALLSSPSTRHIPTKNNLTLSGTLSLDGDWSTIATVFELGDGANITFENLRISQESFTGSIGLALVQTTAGSLDPSIITFDDADVDWSGNGNLVDVISTGPTGCTLQVTNLVVTCGSPTQALFHISEPANPVQIHGLTVIGALARVVQAGAALTVVASDCTGDSGVGVFVTISTLGDVTGSFVGIRGFGSPATTGGASELVSSEWSACDFSDAVVVENIRTTSFTGSRFRSTAVFGDAASMGDSLTFSGCIFEDDWEVYANRVQISGCHAHAFTFGGDLISISGSLFSSCTHAAVASSWLTITGCTIGTFTHTAPFDFTQWQVAGSNVTTVDIQWSTEEVHDFSFTGCHMHGFSCVSASPIPAVSLRAVISGCQFDLSGADVHFAHCNDVTFSSNQVQCRANAAMPPILLGNMVTEDFADVHGIDIIDNMFNIIADTPHPTDPTVGVPVIMVANPAGAVPDLSPNGITISRNTFTWDNAGLVTRICCVVIESRVVGSFRVDSNRLLYGGNMADVTWNTCEGARQAHRMGLLMGWSSYGLLDHTGCGTSSGSSISNNVLSRLPNAAGPAASKWLVYDFLVGSAGVCVIGNFCGLLRVRMFPVFFVGGVAFTDPSLNTTYDNAT